MLGVIWGHLVTALLAGADNPCVLHWAIRTYDMPFFMLISGYFLRFSIVRHSSRGVLVDKVTSLLLPSVAWSFVASRFTHLFSYYFLMAVFVSSVAMVLVSMIRGCRWQVGVSLLLAVLLHGFPDVPFNLSYLFPFFAVGFFLDINRLFHWPIGVPAALVWLVMLCFWTVDYNIWNLDGYLLGAAAAKFGIVSFRLAIAVAGLLAVGCFFCQLYDRVKARQNALLSLLLDCGRLTLPLYILQQIVIFKGVAPLLLALAGRLGHNPLNVHWVVLAYVVAPLSALLLIYAFVLLVRWTKARKPWAWLWGFRAYDFLK